MDIVESHCSLEVKAVGDMAPSVCAEVIVADIRGLFSELGGCRCHFIPRDGNKAAHIVARSSSPF